MVERSKKLKKANSSYYDYFYEEIEARNSPNNYELPESLDGGLSKENVHKITEDIMNPMPSDNDN
jgi:hypothetical protein